LPLVDKVKEQLTSSLDNFAVLLNVNGTLGNIFALPPCLGKPPKHAKLLMVN